MTLQDVLNGLRRHWVTVLTLTILGSFIASVYAFTATPQYVASTTIFVAIPASASSEEAYAGSRFVASRMVSYVDLVTSPALAGRTVQRLHLDIAPVDLARKVKATVSAESVVAKLSVTDSSPETARNLANSLSEDFVQMVQELESTPSGGQDAAARAVVVHKADEARWASPDRRRIIPFGFAVGVMLGVVVALMRVWLSRRRNDDDSGGVFDADNVPDVEPNDEVPMALVNELTSRKLSG